MSSKTDSLPATSIPGFLNLTDAVSRLGFDGVLYSFFPRPMYMNRDVQPVLYFSEGFAPFVTHYLKNNYGNRDFVLRLALQGRWGPIDWWEEIHAERVTPDEREVTEDARKNFGIEHGLSIPVLDGTYAIAGISVISKKKNYNAYKRIKASSLDPLKKLANEYHADIIKAKKELQFFVLPMLKSLTTTKKKILKHLISGQSMTNIEEEHDVSKKYAEKVLANMRKEFGDVSTNELMYILGMSNMEEYL